MRLFYSVLVHPDLKQQFPRTKIHARQVLLGSEKFDATDFATETSTIGGLQFLVKEAIQTNKECECSGKSVYLARFGDQRVVTRKAEHSGLMWTRSK